MGAIFHQMILQIYALLNHRVIFIPEPSELHDPPLTAGEIITLLRDFPLDLIQAGKLSDEYFDTDPG
jgi:hypothetical protein